MKVLFKILSLTLVIALTGTAQTVQAVTGSTKIAQDQFATNNKPIPLALPTTADVVLKGKNKNSITGTVTAFDSKRQMLEISRNGDSRRLKIEEIQQVTFRRDALVYHGDGKQVIRGDDNAQAKQSIWSDVPLQAFELLDPKLGQASVDLATVMNQRKLRPIRSVAVKSLYVADEIEFESTGKMTIKVTPTDR